MLGLKLPTDTRWVELAQTNLPQLLTDHAWCEQKAASNAISMILRHPECPDLVKAMVQIAQEEMQHFNEVHTHILKRGWALGRERKDYYVNDLLAFCRKTNNNEEVLADRLLFAAMVEARSCERFRLLAEHCSDNELRSWYRELMISEANHYTTFVKLARQYAPSVNVSERWREWLEFEAGIIQHYGVAETMHG